MPNRLSVFYISLVSGFNCPAVIMEEGYSHSILVIYISQLSTALSKVSMGYDFLCPRPVAFVSPPVEIDRVPGRCAWSRSSRVFLSVSVYFVLLMCLVV